MSNYGNVTVNIGTNTGVVALGDGNTIELGGGRRLELGELSLPDEQRRRVHDAVASLAAGTAAQAPDAAALKQAVAEAPTPASRTERVMHWLLKIAPAAAGVAGSLLNPAVGKVAERLAGWVAEKIDGAA